MKFVRNIVKKYYKKFDFKEEMKGTFGKENRWRFNNLVLSTLKELLKEDIATYFKENEIDIKEKLNDYINSNKVGDYTFNNLIESIVRDHISPEIRNIATEKFLADNLNSVLSNMDTKAIANAITMATAQRLIGTNGRHYD